MNHIIDVYFESDTDTALGEKIQKTVENALEIIKLDFAVSVSVTVTDNASIREINLAQRNIDKATDVLSFPLLFWDKPMILSAPLGAGDYDPEYNSVALGDIVISLEKAREQAAEYGHSFDREISYLTVHGLLHLFGYDHIDEADKSIMRTKEEEILKIT